MGLAQIRPENLRFAEDIRLIIWDLDETFWDGTLTEGGIRYRMDYQTLVVDLAARGIMSSICSRNDHDRIETLLSNTGLWPYVIFPSIDWSPKGPRIANMIRQIGLRPQSVLFIDDNPMNLAQAVHMCPGLNIALPEVIAQLDQHPQLRGKPDEALSRLAQYKVKERKAQAVSVQDGDTIDFLRRSGVRVFLEYDVEKHIDRAIELITRTNQLNFTKKALAADPERARADLCRLLEQNTTDAALIRVQDDFGDYGFAGFYLTRRIGNQRHLEHFCFSCRTIDMYVEHWTYNFLGRPPLVPVGDVLSDPTATEPRVDWIRSCDSADLATVAVRPPLRYDRIFARGGCDLASLMHYFALHSDHIVEEFNRPSDGQIFRRDHSAFLMPALTGGLTADQLAAARLLGYGPEAFETALAERHQGRTLYVLSFWADADIPVYRHRKTGLSLPYWLIGAQNHDLIAREDLRAAVAETDLQRERLAVLAERFDHEGLLSQDQMEARYTCVLDHVPPNCPVLLVLANERGPLHHQDPSRPDHPHHARLNAALRTVAAGRRNVVLLNPADHIAGAGDLLDLNHFKRTVYHRLYRDALGRLTALQAKLDREQPND